VDAPVYRTRPCRGLCIGRGAPVDQLRWSGQPVGPIGRPQGAYLLKNCYVLKNFYLSKGLNVASTPWCSRS
jgi:hypothetical protein